MLTDDQFNKLFAQTGFKEPRQKQKEVILQAIDAFENGKKYVVINAATGFGKSGVSYAISKYYQNSYFLTHQKFLQEQYKHDFKMPTISSASNYNCKTIYNCHCKQCFKAAMKMARCSDCPYLVAKNFAFSSRECSVNYAFIFTMTGFLRDEYKLQSREFIVCDECHLLPSELIARGTLEINYETHNMMQHLYRSKSNIDLPNFEKMTDMQIMEYVLRDYNSYCESKIAELNEELINLKYLSKKRGLSQHNQKLLKKLTAALTFYNAQKVKIDDFNTYIYSKLDDIVITKSEFKLNIKPLTAKALFKPLIGEYGDKFMFMSGTILDKNKFCEEIGIDPDLCEYISIDSDFPKENRPIYYIPVGSMNYLEKHDTIPYMTQTIDEILNHYPDVKGIIHTVSYELNDALKKYMMNSANFTRMLFVDAKNKNNVLTMFEESDEPYVLVSPSLSEGIDLKDDLSRLCIICKVPYASLSDEWVKRKMKNDHRWYSIKTAETLMQQTGRSIRSKDDHADTFILDTEFRIFYLNNHQLFPHWWTESIHWNAGEE